MLTDEPTHRTALEHFLEVTFLSGFLKMHDDTRKQNESILKELGYLSNLN